MKSCRLLLPTLAALLPAWGCSSPQWAPPPVSSRALVAQPPPGEGTSAPKAEDKELADAFGDDDDDAAGTPGPADKPPAAGPPPDGGADAGQPAKIAVPEPVAPAPKP